MNRNALDRIHEKIFVEGLDILDSDFLNDVYDISDFRSDENDFEDLTQDVRPKDKPEYAFAFYIGFLNLVRKDEIDDLDDITKFNSYPYLKGSLKQYFKGHMNIKYKYHPVSPYHNHYSFVKEWWPRPFSIPESFIKLLNWIYNYDKKLFYELIFNEKCNYIFMSFFKGRIINKFKIKEENIDYECGDELKFYIIFNYLTEPFIDDDKSQSNLMWHYNYNLLKKINLEVLIKIILDYIKSPMVSKILVDVANILKENPSMFYKIFEELEIKNIRELYYLFEILTKLEIVSENKFNIFLDKLENMFTEKYITVDLMDWNIFLSLLDEEELIQIKKLIINVKNDLVYVSELDKEIRYTKYSIDINKSEKFNELLLACDVILRKTSGDNYE